MIERETLGPARLRDGGSGYLGEFLPALDSCFVRLFFFPGPTIAAVNGHAIAGGGVLTLAAGDAPDERSAVRDYVARTLKR